jgi:hypothetical protein
MNGAPRDDSEGGDASASGSAGGADRSIADSIGSGADGGAAVTTHPWMRPVPSYVHTAAFIDSDPRLRKSEPQDLKQEAERVARRLLRCLQLREQYVRSTTCRACSQALACSPATNCFAPHVGLGRRFQFARKVPEWQDGERGGPLSQFNARVRAAPFVASPATLPPAGAVEHVAVRWGADGVAQVVVRGNEHSVHAEASEDGVAAATAEPPPLPRSASAAAEPPQPGEVLHAPFTLAQFHEHLEWLWEEVRWVSQAAMSPLRTHNELALSACPLLVPCDVSRLLTDVLTAASGLHGQGGPQLRVRQAVLAGADVRITPPRKRCEPGVRVDSQGAP